MASAAQVRYARGLMERGGVVGIHVDEDTPVKAASWLIDRLKAGDEPTEDEWESVLREHSDVYNHPRAQIQEGGGYDKSVFNPVLAKIKSQTVRTFLSAMIDELPKYFYHVAASSTGKYHPDFSQNEGGLVRHTMAAEQIMDVLERATPIIADLPQGGMDMARAAIAIHDGWKHGFEEVADSHTIFAHPLLPRKIYETRVKAKLNFDEQQEEVIEQILGAIDSHMGIWNTNKYEPHITLPVPRTPLQKFVHLCDYLSAQKFMTMPNPL